jgi:hypothetical protein
MVSALHVRVNWKADEADRNLNNFTERRLSYHLKNKQNINENIQRN